MLPAASVTLPLLTATAAPPAVMLVPLICVICGVVPSKLSTVAPLVPVIGLKLIAVSSLVLTVSFVMSTTGVMVSAMLLTTAAAMPSLVETLTLPAPLKSAVLR